MVHCHHILVLPVLHYLICRSFYFCRLLLLTHLLYSKILPFLGLSIWVVTIIGYYTSKAFCLWITTIRELTWLWLLLGLLEKHTENDLVMNISYPSILAQDKTIQMLRYDVWLNVSLTCSVQQQGGSWFLVYKVLKTWVSFELRKLSPDIGALRQNKTLQIMDKVLIHLQC